MPLSARESVAVSGVALGFACLSSLGCSSGYVPEGQFWPAVHESFGGAATVVSGGAPSGGANSPGSGGADPVPQGGAANGGNPASGGDSASGGNNGYLAGGGDPSGGGSPDSGGNPGSGGNPNSGGNPSSGGRASGGSTAAGGATSSSCSLSVTVTTSAPGGQFQPKNVGAIWVADSTGKFVKSLEVWANQRLNRLVAWNAATKSAGLSGNKVDAITAATSSSHRTHNATWNCRDTKEQSVPDGSYRVYFEVADSNSGGPNYFVTFSKGTQPAMATGSATNFKNVAVIFKP